MRIEFDLLLNGGFARSGNESRAVTITESFRSEKFSITWSTMNFLIGTITSKCGVQGALALSTTETYLMPYGALGQLLFGSKYSTATTWTSLTWCSFDWRSIRIVEWFRVGNLLLTVYEKEILNNRRVWSIKIALR